MKKNSFSSLRKFLRLLQPVSEERHNCSRLERATQDRCQAGGDVVLDPWWQVLELPQQVTIDDQPLLLDCRHTGPDHAACLAWFRITQLS